MTDMSPTYVLDRTPLPAVAVPELDPSQRAVVDHGSGPLLVLAGPGTGKTTTLVEAVVERVRRGLTPDQVLVLTFSRKAAEELRSRGLEETSIALLVQAFPGLRPPPDSLRGHPVVWLPWEA